jgi:hypothetical protein
MDLLRLVPSLDPALAVVGFGVAVTLLTRVPWSTAVAFPWSLQWLVVALCLGGVTAWVFVSLTVTRTSQAELGLYLLGTLALSGGVAFHVRTSGLFVGFICGLVVANLTRLGSIRPRLMESMVRGERFMYVVLLVLAGALWQLPRGAMLAAAGAYLLVRLIGKLAGACVATRRLGRQQPVSPAVGLGLVSQAGMALAILVDYQLVVGGELARQVMGIGVLAVLANELLAPWLIMSVTGAPSREPR